MDNSRKTNMLVDELIIELRESRKAIDKYIVDSENMKENVGNMFPKSIDYRNRYLIDDKLKIFSEFNSTLLRMRQEKHRTIETEIKIRQGIQKDLNKEKDMTIDDIRKIAEMIEIDKKIKKD